jgi:hypothetical protein
MCRFGSASSGASASLELDIGTSGPYYDMMGNITVYNRQDDCQDMLQCFGLELYSELDEFLEAQRFGGSNQSVYVLFFYRPPPPPRYAATCVSDDAISLASYFRLMLLRAASSCVLMVQTASVAVRPGQAWLPMLAPHLAPWQQSAVVMAVAEEFETHQADGCCSP